MNNSEHPLDGCRGILYGLLMSCAFWALILVSAGLACALTMAVR